MDDEILGVSFRWCCCQTALSINIIIDGENKISLLRFLHIWFISSLTLPRTRIFRTKVHKNRRCFVKNREQNWYTWRILLSKINNKRQVFFEMNKRYIICSIMVTLFCIEQLLNMKWIVGYCCIYFWRIWSFSWKWSKCCWIILSSLRDTYRE
jgi:hypothetical protein